MRNTKSVPQNVKTTRKKVPVSATTDHHECLFRGLSRSCWCLPFTVLSILVRGQEVGMHNTELLQYDIIVNDQPFVRPCIAGADLGGGSRGSGPPLSHMKNDVMHTVIYAAFCMLPSLDLQDCISF